MDNNKDETDTTNQSSIEEMDIVNEKNQNNIEAKEKETEIDLEITEEE